jgi:hypothetical protein
MLFRESERKITEHIYDPNQEPTREQHFNTLHALYQTEHAYEEAAFRLEHSESMHREMIAHARDPDRLAHARLMYETRRGHYKPLSELIDGKVLELSDRITDPARQIGNYEAEASKELRAFLNAANEKGGRTQSSPVHTNDAPALDRLIERELDSDTHLGFVSMQDIYDSLQRKGSRSAYEKNKGELLDDLASNERMRGLVQKGLTHMEEINKDLEESAASRKSSEAYEKNIASVVWGANVLEAADYRNAVKNIKELWTTGTMSFESRYENRYADYYKREAAVDERSWQRENKIATVRQEEFRKAVELASGRIPEGARFEVDKRLRLTDYWALVKEGASDAESVNHRVQAVEKQIICGMLENGGAEYGC